MQTNKIVSMIFFTTSLNYSRMGHQKMYCGSDCGLLRAINMLHKQFWVIPLNTSMAIAV